MKLYTGTRLAELTRAHGLPDDYLRDLRIVSTVLPFRINDYVERDRFGVAVTGARRPGRRPVRAVRAVAAF
ncbi:hypothetical protein [Nocardia africana]|uniref:Uncharacterized protein n=1 Tax=Nocardia africana TaxID=134964 RepID=A0ABW6NS77_9NOCA